MMLEDQQKEKKQNSGKVSFKGAGGGGHFPPLDELLPPPRLFKG